MLAINIFYILSIFFPIISILFLMFSNKNKDITVYKNIRIISIVYIIYMFINFCILPSALRLEVGLEIILLLPIQIIAFIIYIISIRNCSRKIKKINENNIKNSKIYSVSIALILLPILILIIIVLKEITLLNTSDLVLVYDDAGNGGFGDGETLVYTINQDYCKEVSIGAEFGGYEIEIFFIKSPKNLKEYRYNIEYNTSKPNQKYILKSYSYYSSENENVNEINKAEIDYIILDMKKTYDDLEEIYISYLIGSNYYIIESRDLESVFIYEGQKCIHKINLSGNIEIEEAFCFK